MLIYNTLTKKKEEFKPTDPKNVTMYTCGVTVYDHCHIGHGRSLYIFEVIRRHLMYRGFKVTMVRNITDVDDKIINKANNLKDQGDLSLIDRFNDVRQTYIKSYYQDLELLGLPKADFEPRATDNINEMIEYIVSLIEKGFAYEANGSVYFSVRKFSSYGVLSGKKIDDLMASVRIDSDKSKKDSLDFALWKKVKVDEPCWDSPWGKGRPGWHIECSVMSQKYLKTETLDIHGGGRDLVFPHHENECAQSEALTGKKFAKNWIHHGLITINKEKMAKSLGNFFTIKDVIAKYIPDILKLFYLQAHYSSSIDFSWEKMDEVKAAYSSIAILMEKLEKRFGTRVVKNVLKGSKPEIEEFRDQFAKAMDDDFNMPRGLAVLFELVKKCNIILNSDDKKKDESLTYAMNIIGEIAGVFCLDIAKDSGQDLVNDEINKKIVQRAVLKSEKKFKEADEIRDELMRDGIILEDTKEGTVWRREL